ncbi:MAG: hypothetical protein FWD71_23835 [Oscillospiraceae bacterium]|nr:hypothetical protein [Oscillospiraceae bacterium]
MFTKFKLKLKSFAERRFALSIAALALALVIVAGGCAKLSEVLKSKEENVSVKINSELNNLLSYRSEATVEYISNKGSNKYDTVQQCKSNGQYRIEVVGPDNVSGNITLSDGNTIYQYNTRINAKVSVAIKENQERSEIFLTSFIKNYAASASVSAGSFSDGGCTVLEAKVPGTHPYLTTEKLWVDNATLAPVKLVIYDSDGNERVVVTYKTFEYNVPLDDNIFTYSM